MKMKLLTLAVLTLPWAVSLADRPAQAAIERAANQQHRAERVQRQDQLRAQRDARVVSRDVSKSKTDNGFERHATAINAQGQAASRDTVVSRDAESQSRSRETTGQRFDGSSYSSTAVVQKTDDGYTRNATRTNAEGEVASRATTVTRDAETKTVTRETMGQNFDGGSYSASSVKQRTENGYTSSSTRLNADGEMANRDVQVTRDAEAQTVTRTSAGQNFNGESFSGSTVTQKTDDGYTRTSEHTNAAGDTQSRTVVAAVDRDNGVVTKDITRVNAEGESTTRTVAVDIHKSGQ